MTQPVTVNGTRAWRKIYDNRERRLRLAALRFIARRLDLPPLLPPPHYAGEAARRTESTRIRKLGALGVTVPEILDERDNMLVLSDLGPTLSESLRQTRDDPRRRDALVSAAAAAINDVHRRGGYLSQPWPRNLTVHEGGIGFLDFEEDPGEVMSLAHAQARDWLLFAYGTMRFYRDRPETLAGVLRRVLRHAQQDTVSGMARVAERLRPLARGLGRLGASAGELSQVLGVIRSALPALIGVLLLCLGLDWLDDGEFDLIEDLVELF